MHNKESYENINILMDAINYDKLKAFLWWPKSISNKYLDYNKDSQNIAASFVNGTAELGPFITQERIGLPENFWNQESSVWKTNH